QGVFRHLYEDSAVSPPVGIVRYPIKVGETIETEHEGPQGMKITYRVIGIEDVEVPAGKFKAVAVRQEVTIDGTQINVTQWFAAGVGIVKQTVDLAGETLTMLLERFEAGK